MSSHKKAVIVATLALTYGVACDNNAPPNSDKLELERALGDPLVGIKIKRDNAGYVFLFENCTKKHQPVGLSEIRVLRSVSREKVDLEPPVCLVTHQSGEFFAGPSWRYGDSPPGYRLDHCEPLRSGIPYRIDLLDKGFMRFTLAPNGGIASADPQCQ